MQSAFWSPGRVWGADGTAAMLLRRRGDTTGGALSGIVGGVGAVVRAAGRSCSVAIVVLLDAVTL